MGRSIEEIQADIARVKAEMALRNKYEQGFNQPQTRTGWSSYIVNGDRGLLDAYQNRENQWKNQMQQQEFQAKEAEYNRKLQEKIAAMNKEAAAADKELEKKKEVRRLMNEVELAQSDYDAASKLVDLTKPETIATAKKAAAKLNYLGKQLPYEFEDVKDTFEEDGATAKTNKAVTALRSLIKLDSKKWTDEEKQKYVDLYDLIPDDDERKTELYVSLKNAPKTTREREQDEYKVLRNRAIDPETGEINLYLLDSRDRARYNTLDKKFRNNK